LPVDILQWQLALATIRIDGQNCFGCCHFGYLHTWSSSTCGPSPGFPVRGLLRPLRRPGPRGR
jgi:hypothetical protein